MNKLSIFSANMLCHSTNTHTLVIYSFNMNATHFANIRICISINGCMVSIWI